MSTVAVLVAARALVARGWTQYAWAKNERGETVLASATDAVRWCAGGAIRLAGMQLGLSTEGAVEALLGVIGAPVTGRLEHHAVAPWNDAPERTQEEVLEAFDKAIARQRGEAIS
jgi:hypothetical protein